jgi:hypothetical protein
MKVDVRYVKSPHHRRGRALLDDAGFAIGRHNHAGEAGGPDTPVDLSAGDDRHFPAVDESHAAAEVRDQVVLRRCQVKNVGAFEEEHPLLGEEQREAGEIRLTGIDVSFGKVGIGRERRGDVGAKPLGDVEARMKVGIGRRSRRRNAAAGRNRRPHAQASSQRERRQAGQQPGMDRHGHGVLTHRRRPPIEFEAPLNAALEIEVPLPHRGVEAERLDRNADLGGPPGLIPRSRRLPNPVPLRVDGFATRLDDAVEPRPAWIDGEDIAGTPVAKRAEHYPDVIFLIERRIASDTEADDVVRLRVLAGDANDERVTTGKYANGRPGGGYASFDRLDLRQSVRDGRRPPGVLVQVAIEVHGLGSAPGAKQRGDGLLRDRKSRQSDDARGNSEKHARAERRPADHSDPQKGVLLACVRSLLDYRSVRRHRPGSRASQAREARNRLAMQGIPTRGLTGMITHALRLGSDSDLEAARLGHFERPGLPFGVVRFGIEFQARRPLDR